MESKRRKQDHAFMLNDYKIHLQNKKQDILEEQDLTIPLFFSVTYLQESYCKLMENKNHSMGLAETSLANQNQLTFSLTQEDSRI